MSNGATVANQKQILANQRRILANQRRIEANQAKLDKVIANQKKLDRIIYAVVGLAVSWNRARPLAPKTASTPDAAPARRVAARSGPRFSRAVPGLPARSDRAVQSAR